MTYVIFLVNPNTDPETSGHLKTTSNLSSLLFSGFHVFAYINSVLSGFQGAFVSIFYCFFNSETQRHLKLPVRIKASRRITNSFCSRYARIKYLRQILSLLFSLNINKLAPKRKFYGMQRRISNRRAVSLYLQVLLWQSESRKLGSGWTPRSRGQLSRKTFFRHSAGEMLM